MESRQTEIVEIYNPEMIYDNRYVIVPLSSTYNGIESIKVGVEVRNVKKSTNDPKPTGYTSWLQLMRDKYAENGITEKVDDCCLDSKEYERINGVEKSTEVDKHNFDYHNGKSWVGGHMVFNGNSQTLNVGDDFYLLHICSAHNFFQRDKYYFKTRYATYALKMTNFFRMYPVLNSALFELAARGDISEEIEFDIKDFCNKSKLILKNMFFV